MGGFYPRKIRVFVVKHNSKKNCQEIVDTRTGVVFRSDISTRKDAINQCVSLNAPFGFEK